MRWVVKVRDGQVANKPVYVVIGLTCTASGTSLGSGPVMAVRAFWLGVFTEIKARGVQDVCIAVCDGLKRPPEAITTTWELADRPGVHHPPDPQHFQFAS